MPLRRTTAIAAALAALTVALALGGCKAVPKDSDVQAKRKRVELAGQLLDVADVAHTRFHDQVVRALTRGAPREEVMVKEMIRNGAVANVRALALGPEPYGALLDLYVWCRLGEAACANRQKVRPDLQIDCALTYGDLLTRLEGIVARGKLIEPEERAKFDAVIDKYLAEHPDIVNVGLFRIEDLAEYSGTRMTILDAAPRDMLSPVEDAAGEIEQARLVGMQLVWLASRLPNAAGWEAQTVVDQTLSSEEFNRLSGSMETLGKGIQSHDGTIKSLAKDLDAVAVAVDGLGTEISTLGAVRAMVHDALLAIGGVLAVAIVAGAWFLHHLARRIERRIGRE
jgi:hypothetical protein